MDNVVDRHMSAAQYQLKLRRSLPSSPFSTCQPSLHFVGLEANSLLDYVHDRILGAHIIPRLHVLPAERAATLRLSPAWII